MEGTPATRTTATTPASSSQRVLMLSTTGSQATPRSYPGFTSVVSQSSSRKATNSSFSLKFVQAHITEICNNWPNFQKLGQTFVEMSEATANVLHVTAAPKPSVSEAEKPTI